MNFSLNRKWLRPWAAPALAVALAPPLTAAAQEPGPVASSAAPTLDVLVAEVVAVNPELKFYQAEIAAAVAGRKSAGRLANPELSGSVGQKRVTGDGLSAEGVAWSVSVLQPLEWPGRIALRKSIANRDIELAELGYERFKSALAGRVRTLAYGVFAAQAKSNAAKEVAARFRALREVLLQRDPAGLTPLLETRVIEATELNAQRKAGEMALTAQSALLELNQLRGAAPHAPLALTAPKLAFRPALDTAALMILARTNNFELRVRALELAQQGFRVDLARNERFPSLSVGPTFFEENAGDERERLISLSVSLPLPLWNRNKGPIEAAAARRLQAEVSLNLAEREVQRQTAQAALIYETKRQEMAHWRPDAIEHFHEAAEVADRHYRLGAVPISTYVELQKQYLDAVETLLDTRRETLDAAAQLELLAGLPMPLVHTASEDAK